MKIQAVILDFDGVINDSASQKMGGKRIIEIVKRAGREIPKDIRKRLKTNWGLYGPKMIGLSFDLNPETAGKIYEEWERIDSTQFFPLVPRSKQTLKKLKSSQIKVFLLTSRNRENLMAVLNHFGLAELFDLIQAKDDYMFAKPDPRAFNPILAELSKLGIYHGECLYVGDTIFDFECATAAGIKSISVLSGPSNKSDFLKAGQKIENIICSIADLPRWIKEHQDC